MQAQALWTAMAAAVEAVGTPDHVDRLIDLIGADIAHDLVTVTRYSATRRPEFVKHRRFSDTMVRRYLEHYYVYDPFYAHWRRSREPGIVPLRRFTSDQMKRGRYMAEFLGQSRICDEVGIVLEDGGDWCLAIFLDRTTRPFRDGEIQALVQRFDVFGALHALDIKARRPGFMRTQAPPAPAASPQIVPAIPEELWPELSARERELVGLVLAGHPSATIAARLQITPGTVKNHRRRIYQKLDITTERELFLQFFHHHHAL